jgi:type IV pilus assembly protein PilC
MFFSSRLSLSNLIELCRALRHYLGAGLSVLDAFRNQANKGPAGVRPVAGRIVAALEEGDSLDDILAREGDVFPPLLRALVRVGENTGMLAEVFAELEKYYVRQRMLWRQFVVQSAWPIIQFVVAIFVLAGLILVMGLLPPPGGPGSRPLDPLGLGLAGPSGAAIFLGVVLGTLLALGGGYWFLRRRMRDSAALDAFLLGLPAIGPCLRALALARFCTALRLTTETGMSIVKAMRLSLSAAGNGAYTAQGEHIEADLRRGEDLTIALTDRRLFPEEFQHMITVAEESGTLDRVLAHQAEHYHEESGRRLTVLTALAGYGIWLLVGLIIIVAIFRIATWYIGLLN